jgi:hypothetical protein
MMGKELRMNRGVGWGSDGEIVFFGLATHEKK